MSANHSMSTCPECGNPIRKESERCRTCNGRKTGNAGIRHGGKRRGRATPEFRTWTSMKNRCYNEKSQDYPRYGGRGIRVCERWLNSFENFLADMGKRPSLRHSIDRHPDQNGNYEPGNCRWALGKEQSRNRRSNRFLTHCGETLTIAEWSERSGVPHDTLIWRLESGWETEKAIATPVRGLRLGELLEAFGERKTLADWAKDSRCIVGRATLMSRLLHCDWELERAITTPTLTHQQRGRMRHS